MQSIGQNAERHSEGYRHLGSTRVFVNNQSGSALDKSLNDFEAEIKSTLELVTTGLSVQILPPAELEAALEAVKTEGAETVIVAGGDGTIKAAAQIFLGSSIVLGIVPLGTLNRLARDVGIALEPSQALADLATARRERIDIAEVNGKFFLCNSLMGLPPVFATHRQKLRGRPFSERAKGYFSALASVARTGRRMQVTIDDGETAETMRVMSLAVSNNPYGEKQFLTLHRPSLKTGNLGLYVSRHRNPWSLLWVLARASLGLWPKEAQFDQRTARRITIDAPGGHIQLSNDGEVEIVKTPLKYVIHPQALTLLLPRA